MDTYLIKKSDVERVLTMEDCFRVTEEAFRLYGEEKVQMPPKSYLYFEDYFGDLRCMPSYIRDKGAAGIKAVNVHPDNHNANLPTVMATILLVDPKTGFPLAVMDGTHITNMRTGAAGGIASKYLAKKNCSKATFIGAGIQAMTQIEAMVIAKPEIKEISIFDIDKNHSEKFAAYCTDKFRLKAVIANSIHDACANADIINCTTSSRKPIVMKNDVPPGAHINAIGADAMGKQELDSAILKIAKVVIDDWVQSSHSGEINVPVHNKEFTQDDVAAELGKTVAQKLAVRKSDQDITIFDSTGLAVQDLSNAWHVYNKIVNEGDPSHLQTVKIFD